MELNNVDVALQDYEKVLIQIEYFRLLEWKIIIPNFIVKEHWCTQD
jgi:hypothetical protein